MCSEEDKRAMEREIATLREQVEKLGGSTAKKGGAGARRKGVAICAEQLDDDDFVPPIFPKARGPCTRASASAPRASVVLLAQEYSAGGGFGPPGCAWARCLAHGRRRRC